MARSWDHLYVKCLSPREGHGISSNPLNMVIANHKVAAGNAVANIACATPGDCLKVARSCFKNLILLKASLLYLNSSAIFNFPDANHEWGPWVRRFQSLPVKKCGKNRETQIYANKSFRSRLILVLKHLIYFWGLCTQATRNSQNSQPPISWQRLMAHSRADPQKNIDQKKSEQRYWLLLQTWYVKKIYLLIHERISKNEQGSKANSIQPP